MSKSLIDGASEIQQNWPNTITIEYIFSVKIETLTSSCKIDRLWLHPINDLKASQKQIC
jgi:hypothetical protein